MPLLSSADDNGCMQQRIEGGWICLLEKSSEEFLSITRHLGLPLKSGYGVLVLTENRVLVS